MLRAFRKNLAPFLNRFLANVLIQCPIGLLAKLYHDSGGKEPGREQMGEQIGRPVAELKIAVCIKNHQCPSSFMWGVIA